MKTNKKLLTVIATLLIFGTFAGCNKKNDTALAEMNAKLEAMQAELDKAKSGNAASEEIAKLETAVAEVVRQEQATEQKQEVATPASNTTTTQTVTPIVANSTSGNWSVNNGHLTFNNGVTTIGVLGLRGDPRITSVTIPDSVISIEHSAFLGVQELNSVTIGKGVTIIKSDAFSACEKLTNVTIPSSVKEIESSAFLPARKLNRVTFEGDGVILKYGFDLRGVEFGPFSGNLHKVYSGKGTYIRTGADEIDGWGGKWTKQ
jgi:hypothetical protein